MSDLIRIARAVATNQLARFTPSLYLRLTGQTGRGGGEESAAEVADYFRASLGAYFQQLGVPVDRIANYLAGMTLMEYGPGDLPGVAALMVAHGAEKVYCVDRFPMVNLSPRNILVLQNLIAGCHSTQRERIVSCLADPGDLTRGFDPRRIEYLVKPNGLSGLGAAVDLVYSRAVLEHVNDLPATFADMMHAMRPGATAIHLADLASHGLHQRNPLDFLAWSTTAWSMMYSAKGVPNRWRVNTYRGILEKLAVRVTRLEVSARAQVADVRSVRPLLAPPFRALSDDDLACLGFWLVFEKIGNLG